MDIAINGRKIKVTKAGVVAFIFTCGLLIAGLKWYSDTRESNKLVPVLRAQVGDMKVEIDDRTDEIEENVEAIEELTEAVEGQGEQLDGMETNQVIIMRELGVEPVRDP